MIVKSKAKALRIGFVPLCDCAPLIIARELGLFERFGLAVQLKREIGWATLRDKILYGELDAAHALAPMVFATTAGWGSAAVPCLTGLVLNLHGNAITLSKALCEKGTSGPALAEQLFHRKDRLVLGLPFLHSSHHFIARAWLRTMGVAAERRTQFVVVPPPQMPQNLREGHLDGYCVGEPWNSVAALGGFGVIAASSAGISPLHPEKVLMVRSDFAQARPEEHELLIAALIEACRLCDQPRNRDMIVTLLARRQYLNASKEALLLAFGAAEGARAGIIDNPEDFTIFARDNANEPSGSKAAWILENLRGAGMCSDPASLTFSLAKKVFRPDLFERALRLCEQTQANHESERENESISA